jgi:hypothetical protein
VFSLHYTDTLPVPVADEFENLIAQLNGFVATQVAPTPSLSSLGITIGTLANQPTAPVQQGTLYYVTDYSHLMLFVGSSWQFAPGDNQSAYFQDFAVAPSGTGWHPCDGTVTSYVTAGQPTIISTPFTTPNLASTAAYLKSGASYTGAINAASGSTAAGTTGTGTTGTGTTGTGTTGTGTTGTPASGVAIAHTTTPIAYQPGASQYVSGWLSGNVIDDGVQTHPIPGLSVPGLSVPGLSIPGLSVPALGVGTLDVPNMSVLRYFRR